MINSIIVLIMIGMMIVIAYALGSAITFIFFIFYKNEKLLRTIRLLLCIAILLIEFSGFMRMYMKRGIAGTPVALIRDEAAAAHLAERLEELNKLREEGKITNEDYMKEGIKYLPLNNN